ncbi:MAG TPA: hypothetical protein VH540_11065 [Ktedonobacterales bacterium]|jgi:hypothetical protein
MRNVKRSVLIGLSGITLLAMIAAAVFFTGHTQAAGPTRVLISGGTGGFQVPSGVSDTGNTSIEVSPNRDLDQPFANGPSTQKDPPTVAPDPSPNGVASQNQGASGFNGLSHFDTRTASGGNQFSLEPPDQGLCVGGDYVVETVNDVAAVYRRSSHQLVSGPTALNAFYGVAPAIDRTNVVFGPFISDPKCYFDASTGRWFMTTLELDTDPATGAFTGPSHTFIAVSQTSNPTKAWSIFIIDTTDDGTNGTPSHTDCPCLGDQPLIGADKYGFYITTNEFPVFANGFNGAQIYAISKSQLVKAAEHAGSLPSFVQIDTGPLPTPDQGGTWYSIQPATTPQIGDEPNNGTEYFLSALDFFATLDNRVAVWALTNTASLGGDHTNVTLTHTLIESETYGQPPAATQKDGPRPLGTALGDSLLEQLNTNDDRMNQVVFANGLLWAGVNTIVQSGDEAPRSGIAYFIVRPGWNHGQLTASMANQGYVSLENDNVLFPSIGVNAKGQAVMSFSISGPDYFPSTGYASIPAHGSAGAVHISGAGVGPEDGFTGYPEEGGDGVARWGDYSAAVAGPDGSIWLAAEYIPGGARTVLANWGTFITSVNPDGGH